MPEVLAKMSKAELAGKTALVDLRSQAHLVPRWDHGKVFRKLLLLFGYYPLGFTAE